MRSLPRALLVLFLLGLSAFHLAEIAGTVRTNLALGVPEWDYLGFWLHARTATLGQNFYDPAHARALALPFGPTPEFMAEIVNAGFWYPPPSMFLFLPLGAFDPAAALPFWYAFHAAALAASVFLLWRIFFPGGGAVECLACAAVTLAIHGTETTFRFSQTNFVALLTLLLFWRRRHSGSGGAWLVVAAFVKPFLALLVLEPLLARRGRVLVGAMIAGLALFVASGLAFGLDTVLASFTGHGAGAKPYWIYDQPTNQSLLGLVLRLTRAECEGTGCMRNPIYLAGAALLGTITLLLGSRLRRAGEDEWALALYLLLALVVYPVSQLFYSVLLVPPILLAWRHRDRVPGGAAVTVLVLALVVLLARIEDGQHTALAYLALWAAMAFIGWRMTRATGTMRGTEATEARAGL